MDLIFFKSKNTTGPCRGEHFGETGRFDRGPTGNSFCCATCFSLPSMGEAQPSNSCQGPTYTWFPKTQLQGLQKTGPFNYKSTVRPTMEYASTSWDPYKTEDVNCLDNVQCRTAHCACNNYTEWVPGFVTVMVSSLGWEALQDRRKMHRLTMLYKIRHNGRYPAVRIHPPVKRQQHTRGTKAFRPIHQRYSVQDVVFP